MSGPNLKYSIEFHGTRAKIHLVGPLHEEAEKVLVEILDKLNVMKVCIFNVKGLEKIQDVGARAWIRFLRELQSSSRSLYFEECNPEFVSFMNVMPDFKGGQTKILSLYVQLVCEKCHLSVVKLLKEELEESAWKKALSMHCSLCGSPMETEEDEEEYFRCLTFHG